MKYKRMRALGIICAVLAGLCLISAYVSIIIYTTSLISENYSEKSSIVFFCLFTTLSLVYNLFFYAAIPLLVVSGIKLRKSRNVQESAVQLQHKYNYCPFCGTFIESEGNFCCFCGRKFSDL